MKIVCSFLLPVVLQTVCMAQTSKLYHEQYRPQVHFSPKAHWINDPNGMVYSNGIYHLFYQYYPDSNVWGPMHWGHTTSRDLIHWNEQPIALYPDSIGYIFSGSAVVDKNNTSGFGKNGVMPLVAVFTQHDPVGEKSGSNTFQNQSIAYSLDDGKSWVKYKGNPVLKNPGITDFRDPKVMWFEAGKKWIMTLATKDHITFYSSQNLKDWSLESEFGKNIGEHGGVWECPDLFTLNDNGKKTWILTVSVNPGAPNGGSGTQYFIGNFDGRNFISNQKNAKWIDYGPDDYAGVTWSNTGDRKLFLGWMSNWNYATLIPSNGWRNAMTLARELKLKHIGNDTFLTSEPVTELNKIALNETTLKNISVNGSFDFSSKIKNMQLPCKLDAEIDSTDDFSFIFSNDMNESLSIGFDRKQNQYFIERTKSGKTDFEKNFAGKQVAPRLSDNKKIKLEIILDVSSVELFADDGLSVMTALFFSSKPYNHFKIESNRQLLINEIKYAHLNSIWP